MTGIIPRSPWFITVKIDPDLEAFFVAIALLHGTHPKPTFGMDRSRLAAEMTMTMCDHPGAPEVLKKVKKNFRELGGRLDDNDSFFWLRLADAYLDWLYSQEESKKLLPEALAEYDHRDGGLVYRGGPDMFNRSRWKF